MQKILMFTIFVGLIGYSFMLVFGQGLINYISRETINGIVLYKYDFKAYIDEMKEAFTNVSYLELRIPEIAFNDILSGLKSIVNILSLIVNVLFYPLRIGIYGLRSILSILGLPVVSYTPDNPLSSLFTSLRLMIQMQLPYIP